MNKNNVLCTALCEEQQSNLNITLHIKTPVRASPVTTTPTIVFWTSLELILICLWQMYVIKCLTVSYACFSPGKQVQSTSPPKRSSTNHKIKSLSRNWCACSASCYTPREKRRVFFHFSARSHASKVTLYKLKLIWFADILKRALPIFIVAYCARMSHGKYPLWCCIFLPTFAQTTWSPKMCTESPSLSAMARLFVLELLIVFGACYITLI